MILPCFANILRIDFLENPAYKEAFDGSLSPEELLMNIELLTNQAVNYSQLKQRASKTTT
ncbi:MAG: hypothetical protein ACRC4U_04480 [Shewanella sp.]